MKIEFLMNDGESCSFEEDDNEESIEYVMEVLGRNDGSMIGVSLATGKERVRRWARAQNIRACIITDAVPIPPPKLVKGEKDGD